MLPEIVQGRHRRTFDLALTALADYDELTPARRLAVSAERFTVEQVLGDWLPGRDPNGTA